MLPPGALASSLIPDGRESRNENDTGGYKTPCARPPRAIRPGTARRRPISGQAFDAARRWTEPAPLGAGVNTPGGWENFAALSADGCDLVFVRDFSAFYRVSLRAALGQSP